MPEKKPNLPNDRLQRVHWTVEANSDDDLASRYDQWSEEYDSDLEEVDGWAAPRFTAEIFARHAAVDHQILDAGAGTGWVGQELHRLGYKNIHGIVKKGVRVCSSKDKHSDTNTPKLLINGIGSHNYVFYDAYGHYGFTQNMVAVLKPSPKTKILIRSKLFQYLANATKIIGNNFNIATENYLPLFNRSENIKTSQDLYDYFGFSAEEIKEIERRPFLLYENKFIGCSKKKRDVSSGKKTRKKRD